MTIIYILLFGIINLLIFSQLTKKIEIPTKYKIVLISIAIMLGLIHIFEPFTNTLPNDIFLILLGSSLANIAVYFASRIEIWFAIQTTNKKRDEQIFKMFDFLTLYLVYIMSFVVQIGTIINN